MGENGLSREVPCLLRYFTLPVYIAGLKIWIRPYIWENGEEARTLFSVIERWKPVPILEPAARLLSTDLLVWLA